MEQESIELLQQFEKEMNHKEETKPEPTEESVDWKKRYDQLRLKNDELVAVIEKSFEMIRYMGETVRKMGFTFDEINSMFTSN
jgi:hypothetical protein